jgi:flap endonuclease-1
LQEIPPLKWTDIDEEKLVEFLVGEKNFSEDRVRKTAKKIKDCKGKVRSQYSWLELLG